MEVIQIIEGKREFSQFWTELEHFKGESLELIVVQLQSVELVSPSFEVRRKQGFDTVVTQVQNSQSMARAKAFTATTMNAFQFMCNILCFAHYMYMFRPYGYSVYLSLSKYKLCLFRV